MQTATSETESKSLDLIICVHHYTLRAPCPKAQEQANRKRDPWLADSCVTIWQVLKTDSCGVKIRTVARSFGTSGFCASQIHIQWWATMSQQQRHGDTVSRHLKGIVEQGTVASTQCQL